MGKLAAFDYDSWVKGLTLDFTAWDGGAIKISKPKTVKKPPIKVSIHVLTGDDTTGRYLKEHRSKVEMFASRYDTKKDLFDGFTVPDAGRDDLKAVQTVRNNKPLRKTRSSATSNDGMQLLMKAFAAFAEANDTDD